MTAHSSIRLARSRLAQSAFRALALIVSRTQTKEKLFEALVFKVCSQGSPNVCIKHHGVIFNLEIMHAVWRGEG